MNLSSPSIIKQLCEDYNISPQKHRGQNFLVDKNVLDKIVNLADIKKSDVILEIGPGFGVLTEKLAGKAKWIVAVELDKKLFKAISYNLQNEKNIELVNEDILKFQPKKYQLDDLHYRLIANLPYSITSAVIIKFLMEKHRPQDIIVMVQQEVAERIMAKPGEMNLLALGVQAYGQLKILMKARPGSFWPKPAVNSSLLKITVGDGYLSKKKNFNEVLFWRVVRAGFSSKRKQLINNFSHNFFLNKDDTEKWLKQAKISPQNRAEDLSFEDWARLTDTFLF